MATRAEMKNRFLVDMVQHMREQLNRSLRRPFDENDVASIVQLIERDVDETVVDYMKNCGMENLRDWYEFDECNLVLFLNKKEIQLFKGFTDEEFNIMKTKFHNQIRADLTIGINDLDDDTEPYSEIQIYDVLQRFDEQISETVRCYLRKAGDLTDDFVKDWCIVDVECRPMKLVLDDVEYAL